MVWIIKGEQAQAYIDSLLIVAELEVDVVQRSKAREVEVEAVQRLVMQWQTTYLAVRIDQISISNCVY